MWYTPAMYMELVEWTTSCCRPWTRCAWYGPDHQPYCLPSPLAVLSGSLPCLRPAHHIDSKGLRSGIDLRRIPHKMLETPASHKEEPDAWILSVSKPGLHYQHSG